MEKTRKYLGLFVISPEKEKIVDSVKGAVKTIITENAGTILNERCSGRRTLGSLMKKKGEGLYYEVIFTAEPHSIEKINRLCRINTDLLRSLIDKVK
ncbi:Ribosomal protein S6 [Candidatus Omnitrophus magneticus]|uniref:Small ribosomal subunit protein bS6 n=1 Tax=Candidatus Omnitrophus magneticus TaxID=1609969 RepID=A0A0F0CQP4_9BACT|nr:Ribosomal protein S6 [Candidatus Omnitrophus magneticus]